MIRHGRNMAMIKTIACAVAAGALWSASAQAESGWKAGEFRFNRMYSSSMVLQRDEPIKICGYGPAGMAVKLEFRGETVETKTGADGKWRAQFKAGAAGGPFTLAAECGGKRTALEDVMVGDVWFLTGQSNMWWPMCRSDKPEREIAAADEPNIRLFDVALIGAEEETDEVPYARGWSRCTPSTIRDFSACGFHFARTVREKIGDVPIGLIGSAWPGPPIRHFIPTRHSDTNYLALSRRARDAASKAMAAEDAIRKQAEALFSDVPAMERRASAAFDISRGGKTQLPVKKGLEHTILKDYCGVAQFRRVVTLPLEWAGKTLKLELGASSLPGRILFNGKLAGKFKEWSAPIPGDERNLAWTVEVDGALVKSGENAVDVLVGCNDRLSWWGAFSGRMRVAVKDKPEAFVDLSEGEWDYDKFMEGTKPDRTYGGSWGARTYPFFAMPVKGVLFYQGESDSKRTCEEYLADHKKLIGLLRNGWGKEDLPFYCMQLANFSRQRNEDNGFCEIREAQRLTPLEVPHTGMACSIDIGEDRNIHPGDKREQGRRMALQALAKTYGCKDVAADGMEFAGVKREADGLVVEFKPADGKIVLRGEKATGFEVLGADGAWKRAEAEVCGSRVKLKAEGEAKGVRYLWQNWPEPAACLFDETGLPVSPFRAEVK